MNFCLLLSMCLTRTASSLHKSPIFQKKAKFVCFEKVTFLFKKTYWTGSWRQKQRQRWRRRWRMSEHVIFFRFVSHFSWCAVRKAHKRDTFKSGRWRDVRRWWMRLNVLMMMILRRKNSKLGDLFNAHFYSYALPCHVETETVRKPQICTLRRYLRLFLSLT